MTAPNIVRLWGYKPPPPLRGVFHQSKMLGQHLGKGTGAEVVSDPPENVILEMLKSRQNHGEVIYKQMEVAGIYERNKSSFWISIHQISYVYPNSRTSLPSVMMPVRMYLANPPKKNEASH